MGVCSTVLSLPLVLLLFQCHFATPTLPQRIPLTNDSTIEKDANTTIKNGTATALNKKTVADKVEHLVKEEFAGDIRDAERKMGHAYNESTKSGQGLETVVRVTSKRQNGHTMPTEKGHGNSTGANQPSIVKHEIESDVDRMIDSHDNEFVLSKPKELAALTLDPVFIQDLTILYTSAACMGIIFESLGQPVINGYFVAGSIVGSGGFMLITELVQVQSLAQLGVQLLLFHLGLEFSLSKMQQVGGVAFVGGLVEMGAFVSIAIALASAMGGSVGIGAFIGALVSLSSTSVVANCLETSKSSSSQFGQITIGTLILQDCTVGILFAIMPLLSAQHDNRMTNEESAFFPMVLSLLIKLVVLGVVGAFVSRTALLPLIQKADAYKKDLSMLVLSIHAVLLRLFSWIGLSHELGAFVAGCLLSSSPHATKAIKSTEGARNIFMTLFMASIGLMMSPTFLWEHLSILTCSVLAVLLCKASVISFIVRLFGFDAATSLLVGLSLAQISEFAFVLLSIAVDAKLLKAEMYLLLVGVTGLSLLCTPLVISTSRFLLRRSNASAKEEDEAVALYVEDQVRRNRHFQSV